MIRKPIIAAFCLCALTLTLVPSKAEAQVKPFKVTGSGVVPQGIPFPGQGPRAHWAVGQATELGRYYGQGAVQTDAFTGPTTANFSSAVPFVFTAANGDDLAFHYGRVDFGAAEPGHVELFPAANGRVVAVWLAEFTPVYSRCTGRFARLTGGSFLMLAMSEPFVPGSSDPVGYSWSGQGWIEFAKGK